MRIRLITFCSGKNFENYDIIDNEECKSYHLIYNTEKVDEDKYGPSITLQISFKDGNLLCEDLEDISEFSVDGDVIIKHGDLSDKYDYRFPARLMNKKWNKQYLTIQ